MLPHLPHTPNQTQRGNRSYHSITQNKDQEPEVFPSFPSICRFSRAQSSDLEGLLSRAEGAPERGVPNPAAGHDHPGECFQNAGSRAPMEHKLCQWALESTWWPSPQGESHEVRGQSCARNFLLATTGKRAHPARDELWEPELAHRPHLQARFQFQRPTYSGSTGSQPTPVPRGSSLASIIGRCRTFSSKAAEHVGCLQTSENRLLALWERLPDTRALKPPGQGLNRHAQRQG